MSIKQFITGHWEAKLKEHACMVIYDPEKRYHELLPELGTNNYTVIDVMSSPLLAREEALAEYNSKLLENGDRKLVVYVPYAEPQSKQEKIGDPFFIFTFGGCYFPYDATDQFISLCKACYPGKEEKIDELFQDDTPDFDTIDALGGGNSYAKLQGLTGCQSEKEILLAILTPGESQGQKLQQDKTWVKEYKELVKGLGLVTKEKTLEKIQQELWRFILFSEFVFDLPVGLPPSLQTVPSAKESAKNTVLDICRQIRDNKSCEEVYVANAEVVEQELGLAKAFENEFNLGSIVTFAFEDNSYFQNFITQLLASNYKEAEITLGSGKHNIWHVHNEERKKYWMLAELGLKIINTKEKFPSTALIKTFIEHYTTAAYKIDQYQRQFERIYSGVVEHNDLLVKLVDHVRVSYLNYTERVQKDYLELLQENGWPVSGLLSNLNVFPKKVEPLIKQNIKTAYLLVDALRFELAKELEEGLQKYCNAETLVSCAYLPTVTKYGMAALLPEAEKKLSLKNVAGKLEAVMNEVPMTDLNARRQYLQEELGSLCAIKTLDQFLNNPEPGSEKLLVITTNEIDSAGESYTMTTALAAMHQSLHNLTKAILLLFKQGFEKIIVATDHGFVLHPYFRAGDNISKPSGEWVLEKSRCLTGKGDVPDNILGFSPEKIGIRSDVQQFLFLKNYTVFEKNTTYFHEGLSLQENIVPVMLLSKLRQQKERMVEITLTYRGKSSGFITSRRPVLELAAHIEGELGLDPISLRIEAIADGTIVGLPAADERVNETTKLVDIYPQQACKISLEMYEYEGRFTVNVSDPVTSKLYTSITLETDYIS